MKPTNNLTMHVGEVYRSRGHKKEKKTPESSPTSVQMMLKFELALM